MRSLVTPALAALFVVSAHAQIQAPAARTLPNGEWEISVERTIPVEFLGTIQPFVLLDSTARFRDERVRNNRGLIGENEEAEEEMEGRRGHSAEDPDALPHGADPALQTAPPIHGFERAVDITVNGMGNTPVSPADPCLSVGTTHVIQMINGSSGSYFRIYDKNLANPGTQTYLDNFVNALGDVGSYSGAGDPIVLWDDLASRWVMTEFSSSGNRMIVAVSTSADPTGSWNAYSFTAPGFPDYPKYAVWSDCYVVTTNESSPAIYALPRANMLAGTAGTAARFTISSLMSIGFQAATPVHFGGGTAPPAGAPAMFMRMVDDQWTSVADVDRLELWKINYNAATPASSTITGPTAIPTDPFDSSLCGYTTLNCINQPGSQTMDPIRELLMNRVCYRNLGGLGYEAIVCAHAVDVNATDRAAMRWYELHRTGGIASTWGIHQQGTYSPDANDRWMGSIAINNNGDIGLSYNIAGTTGGNVYPGIRYTGRYKDDPLNQMTFAETSIVAGSASNDNNRYGDYGSLDVDPVNGTAFYGTAMYNPAAAWSTRMFKFSFPAQGCTAPTASTGITDNCGAGTFMLSVTIGANGSAPNYDVYTSVNGAGQTFNSTRTPGTYTVGTYAFGTSVVVQVRHNTNATCNQTLAAATSTGPGCAPQVSAKVFLEGPYDTGTGLMSDALRAASLLPNTQPFTALGYAFTGSPGAGGTVAASVFTTTGSNAIVDWVILELRNAAAPSAIVASCAALVQRDGDVVALDGTSPVSFVQSPGSYYVAVRHRNHLGVMTAGAISLPGTVVNVDFTTVATSTYGTEALTTAGSVQALWTGDVTFNKQVLYTGSGNDRDPILVAVGSATPNNAVSGYAMQDTNLDGVVKYTGSGNDRDRILVNVGSATPNNTRSEQLP
jgi:hypothetical protein